MASFSVLLAASPPSVTDGRLMVRSWLASIGVVGDRARDIAQCVTELVANSVLHAYSDGHGDVDVDLTCEAETIVLVVSDRGKGFCLTQAGVGLHIVMAVSDDLTVKRAGNVTRVVAVFAAPS